MSVQEQMTFEERQRIIARAKEALEKVKREKAESNRERIEEMMEREKCQKDF